MLDFTGGGGRGQKPTGMISVNGILYLAVQNLEGFKKPRWGTVSQHGSDAAIFFSPDYGVTWYPSKKEMDEPMFKGCLFGSPAFINCGKDNAHAPDSFIYAVSGDQWDNGSELRLGRVHLDSICQKEAWRWVSSFNSKYEPIWGSDMNQSLPVLINDRSIGSPEMIYIPETKRYLLLTWKLKNDFNALTGTELFIFDAPKPWGPFTLVYYEPLWEFRNFTPYCPRVPLKWLEVNNGVIEGTMLFSGSWTQEHIYYRPNFRKFKLSIQK